MGDDIDIIKELLNNLKPVQILLSQTGLPWDEISTSEVLRSYESQVKKLGLYFHEVVV